MGICQRCYNPTKGSRKLCSKCNVKINEWRVAKRIEKFAQWLNKNNFDHDIQKKLWQTFKPLFSKRLKREIKQKKRF